MTGFLLSASGFLAVLIVWVAGHGLATILRRYGPVDNVHIPEPVPRFPKLTPGEVEALRVRAEIRQKRAEAKRTEGNQIASGEPERAITLIRSKGSR